MSSSSSGILVVLCLGILPSAGLSASPQSEVPDVRSVCPREVEKCIAAMREELQRRGAVGMAIVSRQEKGRKEIPLEVDEILEEGPADKAGIRKGDVVVEWDGIVLSEDTGPLFDETHRNLSVGSAVVYTVMRGKERLDIRVVAEAPHPIVVRDRLMSFVRSTYGQETWEDYARREYPELQKGTDK